MKTKFWLKIAVFVLMILADIALSIWFIIMLIHHWQLAIVTILFLGMVVLTLFYCIEQINGIPIDSIKTNYLDSDRFVGQHEGDMNTRYDN